ncbi:hypothetical protein Bhyg_02144 [Pseudolycoriella hygida]|uniref:PPPDE domain-containing protein n=1 Tax=Pseudolycoriella hygida TaxID=35572 RepID=A0A9Q0S8A1_9DIPT|nr:hypothetical protein Bhyg_02144 [Pseudolycoriella hygida]
MAFLLKTRTKTTNNMVWIKVCSVSLQHFSSSSDGRPTDTFLERKASKATSPPSQAHAFIEIYTCMGCFERICQHTSDHPENFRTEVQSTGVLTSVIYKAENMAADNQVVHKFQSLKTVDEIKKFLREKAIEIPKYNVYNNNCIVYVQSVCEFLGEEVPANKLQELQEFMEKLSSKTGWAKLIINIFLLTVCPLLLSFWYLQRFS